MRKRLDDPQRDALYLDDILASTILLASYLRGVKRDDFATNDEKVDSVSRRLIVIGEAVKSLSQPTLHSLRKGHPDIRWNDIAKLKDKLAHHYWTIDLSQLWEIAKVHVPILKRAIEPLAKKAASKKP